MRTKILGPVLAMSTAFVVFGENCDAGGGADRLTQLDLEQLMEIPIVSAARHEQSRLETPRSVSVMTGEEIRRRNFRNVPEAVAGVAGVYLQQTNYAGGSPVIRGMVGNRILLMINGVRLNNGTYRLGPNQYLNSIDVNQVERIEVVRGAGSVLYGSDAFGGVINVITQRAPDPRNGPEFSTRLRIRFATADSSGAGRIQVATACGRLGLLVGYTMEQFGDLTAGGGAGLQRHTGYRQSAGDIAFTLDAGSAGTLTGGLSRLKQSGVPRTDMLVAGSDLQHLWNPGGLDLAYVRYEHQEPFSHIDSIQITAAWQRPFEFREQIAAANPFLQMLNADVVNTASLSLQLTSTPAASHVLRYGLEGASDWISSRRTDVNLRSGGRSAQPGLYADGSRLSSLALFVQDEIAVSDRLAAVVGGRYDQFHTRAALYNQSLGDVPFDARPSAFTASGHVLYKIAGHFSATVGLSQGFRAPSIDDSTILGRSGQRFEFPNAHLKPERSVNFEYGVRAHGRFGSASIVLFEDRYRDLIDRGPATWNELPYVDLNGNGKQESDEPLVYQRQNISRASVRGLEIDAVIKLARDWTWSHMTTWTRGTDTSASQPLTRIPPLNGASRITWEPGLPFWAEGVLVTATAQRRLAPADRKDVRIGPAGTAGYAVIHLRAGLRRTCLAGLSVAWENVTNRRYRLHGSGFDRPGSNVVLGFSRAF